MENLRYNISPCTPEEASAFIAEIDESKYVPRSRVQADEKSHYDRYAYTCNNCRVAVVYDTTAQVISITAPRENADELLTVFSPNLNKTVKCSAVPAQGTGAAVSQSGATRSKVFVSPKTVNRNPEDASFLVTARGAVAPTDEIYPRARAKSRNSVDRTVDAAATSDTGSGLNISVSGMSRSGRVRKATISFGDEDESKDNRGGQGVTLRSGTGLFADIATNKTERQAKPIAEKRYNRARPTNNGGDEIGVPDKSRYPEPPPAKESAPEYKNGYSVKNYSQKSLDDVLKALRAEEKYRVCAEGADFIGTPQEVKAYSVTDNGGQKVILRYSVGRKTLQLQGKRSGLFGEVQSMVSRDTDYSSALEGYVDAGKNGADSKVSQVRARLKKRLPTAYEFLSEQSRIDFSYGMHDLEQATLSLLDYSVLLVPPYRGLERFIFDLQRAENINVKMIGQAYDKDDSGRYILKRGYQNRIGSVIYAEVMVSLYNEYFSRRNFFAHSDNTDGNASRSISDRTVAKRIFDNLLNTVEYNARKLKEIGFSMERDK